MYKHMEDRGAPINRTPMIDGREVDLYRLFKIVYKLGGHARVTNKNIWQQVAKKLGFETAWCVNQVSKPFFIAILKQTVGPEFGMPKYQKHKKLDC